MLVVGSAGRKELLNCRTWGWLPTGLSVFGSTGMPSRKYPAPLTMKPFWSGWKSPRRVKNGTPLKTGLPSAVPLGFSTAKKP
jgi:hypothetical protein